MGLEDGNILIVRSHTHANTIHLANRGEREKPFIENGMPIVASCSEHSLKNSSWIDNQAARC